MTEPAASERNCQNCGCAYRVHPPADAPIGAVAVLICRRNPPETKFVEVEGRIAGTKQLVKHIVQPETLPYMVCWGWVEEGALPGQRWEWPNRSDRMPLAQ